MTLLILKVFGNMKTIEISDELYKRIERDRLSGESLGETIEDIVSAYDEMSIDFREVVEMVELLKEKTDRYQ